MTSTVTGKNQVTIPADIITAAKIELGTRLDWSVDARAHMLLVRILPSRAQLARSLLGSGRKYLKPGQDPVAELCQEREADDAEKGMTNTGNK